MTSPFRMLSSLSGITSSSQALGLSGAPYQKGCGWLRLEKQMLFLRALDSLVPFPKDLFSPSECSNLESLG